MRLIFLILTFVSFCFAHDENHEVNLYLKSKHQFQYAGFYIAKEKGFFKEYGLDVHIKESEKAINTTNLVLENDNSFGISDSILIYEKMLGKKISPLGAIFQHSPLIFLTLEKSKINTPSDFENKKIMLDLESNDNTLVNTIKKKYNLTDKKLQKIPTSNDINDLISGKVDIYAASLINDIFLLQKKGVEYNYIYPLNFGFDFYGDILFTSESNIKANPKRAKNFYKASMRGWKYAFENIDETIKLILKKYNTQKLSYENYLYEAEVLKDLSEVEKGNLGKLELKRINHILSTYFLSKNDITLESINDYDFSLSLDNNLKTTKNEYSNENEEQLIKLIKKPFYEMNIEQIKNIFEVYLQKDYMIALQLYDSFLDEVIFTSWIDENKILHKEMKKYHKNFNPSKIFQEKEIIINNKKIGYLRIYYKNSMDFTPSEYEYLKNKKVLKFCTRNSFHPYSFFENNKYKGIIVDFMKVLESKINAKIELVRTKNWDECLSYVDKGKVDFSSIILSKPNVFENLEPTKPYLTGHLVLATRIDEPFLIDIEKIEDNIIGINSYSKNIKQFILNEYPYLKLKEFNGTDEGLKALADNKIYGFIDVSSSLAYRIQNKYAYELKIMNRLDDSEHGGSMGVKVGNNILLSILNKSIDLVSDKTKREIKNSWISIQHEKTIDYSLILKILVVIGILFVAFMYRQFLLKKVNRDLKNAVRHELRKNREKDKLLFQQAKLASMGEMLNNIAHQWRQPLNAINSNVAVLDSIFMKKNIIDNNLEKNLIEIENQTKYMSETIESFRNFFNPEKDKQFFLISNAVDDAISIINYNFNRLNIRIRIFNVNDTLIEGYLGEYIQTIISILNNSRDAFVSKKCENAEINIYIDEMIMIEDNAGGIDEKIIDRIFEPYFTTKHKDKGTGTGLYMAKMIIEHSMNGNLSVENIKNGCRFKIKV
ncbi:ABC transporter substrate-binding protein [Arcobacter sp. LA11]|uniref:ABC transporter substrate-binding protein n=1 Tax=Arcobacter sp. LA11 TaxID=1898176 RepID=UPI00093402E0|nr:ABC transporter substrate-binding protein [Arcobacter sp. LA11]